MSLRVFRSQFLPLPAYLLYFPVSVSRMASSAYLSPLNDSKLADFIPKYIIWLASMIGWLHSVFLKFLREIIWLAQFSLWVPPPPVNSVSILMWPVMFRAMDLCDIRTAKSRNSTWDKCSAMGCEWGRQIYLHDGYNAESI